MCMFMDDLLMTVCTLIQEPALQNICFSPGLHVEALYLFTSTIYHCSLILKGFNYSLVLTIFPFSSEASALFLAKLALWQMMIALFFPPVRSRK